MFENCFCHSLKSVESLDVILSSGAIVSTKNLYGTEIALKRMYGCNGIDYISVSKMIEGTFPKNKDNRFYAWWFWTSMDISIMIDDKIDAIKTKCTYDMFGKDEFPEEYSVLSQGRERYSPFRDEWHVKDKITRDHFVGISLPLSKYFDVCPTFRGTKLLKQTYLYELRRIKEILVENNIDLPFYDPVELKPICLEENIEKIKELTI